MSFNEYWQAEQNRTALREAMVEVRNRSEGAIQKLQAALRKVILLVPVREVPPHHEIGDTVRGANVPLQVMLTRDEHGGQHLTVFTSEQELVATYPAAPPFIGLSFDVLAHLATQAPIVDVVIDRNGGSPVTLPPSLLTSWARPAPVVAGTPPPATPLVAGQAQLTPPPRMVTWQELQALEQVLREQVGLVQAYLFGVMHGAPPPLLTVGLGFTTQPTPETMQLVARAIGKVLGASGVLALDSRLPLMLARQAGAIRFDLDSERVALPPQANSQPASQEGFPSGMEDPLGEPQAEKRLPPAEPPFPPAPPEVQA